MKRQQQDVTAAIQRPLASDAEIREMHEKASVHQLAADQHEAQAQHDLAAAERLASDMVANAQAEAARIVREAQQSAAAHERQAEERAKDLRAVRDAEAERAQFWASLAAEESVRAGLPQATPTLTEGELDTREVTP